MEAYKENLTYMGVAEGSVLTPPREYATQNAVESVAKKPVYAFVKRTFDLIFSLLGLIILSPFLLVVAIIIKLEDGGPVIYTRYCVGKNSKTYKMYKFRSMVVNADDVEHLLSSEQQKQFYMEQKVDDDPRLTKIGKFIRKTSIDELPQLLSILKGDMSFVGPRPIVSYECVHYGSQLEFFLCAKPGLTGLWQVSGRSDCTYESGERQEIELSYVQQRSIRLDIKILFQTVGVVLKKVGAR